MDYINIKKKDLKGNYKVNIDRRKKLYPIDPREWNENLIRVAKLMSELSTPPQSEEAK